MEKPIVKITRWMVDTRNIWPGNNIQYAAPEYLALIPPGEERKSILRKYMIADARMCLASALLKRAYIAKETGLPFRSIEISTRDSAYGKPYWASHGQTPPRGEVWPYLDFNVSHQAGITTLVGISVRGLSDVDCEGVLVGCDIVAPEERLQVDLEQIMDVGFEEYISGFDVMFHYMEITNICKYKPPSSQLTSTPNANVKAKLRLFYTYFCLKEAYVKLLGEGLLAGWIKECKFMNVKVPTPSIKSDSAWGEKITAGRYFMRTGDIESREVLLDVRDNPVTDVRTELQAFEEGFVIATMLKPSSMLDPDVGFPDWELLDLYRDIFETSDTH